jgi:hypothetical protein
MGKELDELKVEAEELGLKVPGNISLTKLKAKIADAKGEELPKEEPKPTRTNS